MTDLSNSYDTAIAIIGMSGRFPGADSTDTLWRNIGAGVESSTTVTDADIRRLGVPEERASRKDYVRTAYVVDGIDQFDAGFFNFTPRDAEILDPQQRIFLETSWHALENAGYVPEKFPGRIGVYAGTFASKYLFNVLSHPSIVDTVGELTVRHGNDKDYLATRVSYKLNLRGPSISVQTSCSTSLVAVHMAVQSLLAGECDMALAGGVSIDSAHGQGYLHQPGGLMSPDGKCRPFDADAQGTVFGDGIGIVVLRRYTDAVADGSTIYAVIRGTAVNNDGSDKVGFTAPSVNGQAAVIADALAVAGVPAQTIGLIEAHGTGTPLGDPIEIEALSQVYGAESFVPGACALGSIKGNIGHLGIASGVTGLIKACLALHHRQLPPSINYTKSNPHIDFASSPFSVNTQLREWPTPDGYPRRAAVSSFGMGGTNAHVVLEEMPVQDHRVECGAGNGTALRISGKNPTALKASLRQLAEFLRDKPSAALSDVAATLRLGRRDWAYRYVCQGDQRERLIKQIEEAASSDVGDSRFTTAIEAPELVFVFPGQGSQYVGACRNLYQHNEAFRSAIDECRKELAKHSDFDILSAIEASPDDAAVSVALQRTENTQPFLFALEYSLAKMLEAIGLRPSAMLGHSVGEIVAATLAGVFDLSGAMHLIAVRGKAMQRTKPGRMLAVMVAEHKLRELLTEHSGIEVAAINSPTSCVVAGEAASIEGFASYLSRVGVMARPLRVEHAFHSSLLDPVLEAFESDIAHIPRRAPQLRFISNVSGTWADPSLVQQSRYWVEQMRCAVRFGDGVHTLIENVNRVFVEVGPGSTLTGLIKAQMEPRQHTRVISLVRTAAQESDDRRQLAIAVENLWLNGVDINLAGEPGRRIPFPGYTFDHKSYWLAGPNYAAASTGGPASSMSASSREAQPPEEHPFSKDTTPGATGDGDTGISTEKVLTSIWIDLFNVAVVDEEEDFFSLGGTSLAAMQLVARIKELVGIELSMEELLEDPTLRGITACVSARLL